MVSLLKLPPSLSFEVSNEEETRAFVGRISVGQLNTFKIDLLFAAISPVFPNLVFSLELGLVTGTGQGVSECIISIGLFKAI